MEPLTLTMHQTDGGIATELWCPAFVATEEHDSPEDALTWARARLDGVDPFEEYQDE